MKVTQKDFQRNASRAAQDARIFFFCGPDESGAHDAAAQIVRLLPHPGERVEFAGAELKKDPVRLGDESRSQSLFGETRHIFVRVVGDEAHDAVATLLDGGVEACPVLIVASGATDKSRTAKLLANRPDALVAMFYPPDLRAVTAAVRTMADTAGLRIDGGIAERMALATGLDTRLARSEVEKLALYLDASTETPRSASASHLDAIAASTEDDGYAPVVEAVLGGKSERISLELRRMRELGLNPVGLLLAFERRVAQLATLSARLGSQGNISSLLDSEASARRIRWQDKASINAQLRRWRGNRLNRLVDRLLSLHQSLLANSRDDELLLAHGLAQIAAVSSRSR
ncbi:MAG: DNA polymerase III subunit delta [Novosphingobium sp.]|nr:DNA polymerase III subunit delta [Novosphingobium sp.]